MAQTKREDRLALGSNGGHLETMPKLWEWGKNNPTIEDISNKLLFGTDKEGRSVLKFAAMNGHFETLDKVWEWAKENLATEEINNELFFCTKKGGPSGTWQHSGTI